MKRVLGQTPPWLVVPVSVLAATLLLVAAHRGVESGKPDHHTGKSRTRQQSLAGSRSEPCVLSTSSRRPADCETPPVTRYSSVTADGDPSTHLLARKEREPVGLAKSSDVVPNDGDASSPRYLVSSDAVSVLAAVDRHEQANTGWLPTNSNGTVSVRPVPLVPIAEQPPEARYAKPLPRYGSNAQGFDEMPLVAPIETAAAPVELSSVDLIGEMFLAPPSPIEREKLKAVEQSETVAAEDPVPALMEAGSDAVSQTVEPLPPTGRSEGDIAVPILPVPDVVVPLPPVERIAEGKAELCQIGAMGSGSGVLGSSTGEVLMPLPPVERDLSDTAEIPSNDTATDAGVVQGDRTGDVLMPLPPVEANQGESVADIAEPALIPLPPVEPRSVASGESTAMLMIEGRFESMAEESEIELGEVATGPATGSEGTSISGGPTDEPGPVGDGADILWPLPSVERDREVGDVSGSAPLKEELLAAEKKGRSWELELIAQEADEHSRRGFELAGKKAHFAARLEFTRALRIIAQGLDTEHKTNRHSRALAAGLRALTEAEDFLPKDGHLEAELDLVAIAGAHRTPVLHEDEVHGLTPLVAIRKYHTFAQEQLAAAVGNEVAGSMALCGLGKLYVVIGDQQRDDEIAAARTKAMVLLQAALMVAPANHMASNELGVLFARNGRHREARAAFQHSVSVHPTEEGWRNLALTCERLGEMDLAYRAARQSLALRDSASGKTPLVKDSSFGTVRWVSPGELDDMGASVRTASTAGGANRAR